MRKALGIARYTFIEIFRNKVYYVLVLFTVVLFGATLLLSTLGGEQSHRMLIDFGLASIEGFCLLIAVFASVTLVLEEMESRTLYLILSRPVARYQFILGRFLGLLFLLTLTYVVMMCGHLLLLRLQSVHPDSSYFVAVICSWGKIVLITAIGIAFSLFATSMISAVSFTLFFWIMGHFTSEMRYLAEKSAQPLAILLLRTFYYLIPNFQLLNLRDLPPGAAHGALNLLMTIGYGVGYTTACLAVAILLFRKKEF